MQLTLLIWIPLLTALVVLMVPAAKARLAACLGAVVQLAFGFILLGSFLQQRSAGNNSQMLFEYHASWFSRLSVQFHFGVDGTAVAMILLTALVVLSGILVSWSEERLKKEFFFLLTLLSMGAYGFFISLDLFTFFFFLEIAVIPKFLLIGIWGSGKKEYSAMKLALMLMAGSALVFLGLIGVYNHASGSFDMLQLQSQALPLEIQKQVFPFLFLGFGIFAAIFPFHTWVPDGHASAPTAASMFLAGISMKLGGYGCLRVATMLMPAAALAYSWIIVLLSTIAIVYGAFATMMQKDLKYINAYSSVSHCGFVLLGIGIMTPASINGAVLQMISHGLMTALFFAAIGMIYSRTHTRMTADLGGLLKVMPFASTVFVLAGLCSLGLPGLSGFVAEMTVFMGAWQRPEMGYRLATILSCASIVITAVYILRAAGKVIMGPIQEKYLSLKDAYWYERIAAIILILAILVMGLAPFWIQDLVNNGLAQAGVTVLPK